MPRNRIKKAYSTARGTMYRGSIESFLASKQCQALRGKVQLILTSPPFPLNRKKKYGNLTGEPYLTWLSSLANPLSSLLKPDGSIVMELGNAWVSGLPTMSPLSIKALLSFLEEGQLHLCQQFIWYNPAKLPTPAQWVNIDRIRVKDSFTHIWWMSKSPYPKANNRNVLTEYSAAMQRLLRTQKYNASTRPSEHSIGPGSFLKDNEGAIPPNVLTVANTRSSSRYLDYCKKHRYPPHPARMPEEVAEFFINFISTQRNLVFDPFAGSNTTGATAESLKRRWISLEIRDDYVLASKGRFSKR